MLIRACVMCVCVFEVNQLSVEKITSFAPKYFTRKSGKKKGVREYLGTGVLFNYNYRLVNDVLGR